MERKDNGFVVPIIGALVGGLLATVPWILCYVYLEMILSILAIFVAIAALKGYQLLKGRVDKKLPVIILVISLISITVATLVIIPNLLVIKEYGRFSLDMFKALYEYDEFRNALIGDYVISLLFTVLGTSGVISSIKRDVSRGKGEVTWNSPLYIPSEEEKEEIKKLFVERNAVSKDLTIPKEEVFSKLSKNQEAINYLINYGIIRKRKGGLYYSLANESNPKSSGAKIAIIVTAAILAFIAISVILAIVLDRNESKPKPKDDTKISEQRKVDRDVISYELIGNFTDFKKEDEDTTYIAVPSKDQTGSSGYVSISYYEMENDSSYEEINKNLKKEFKKNDEFKDDREVEVNSYKTRLYNFEFGDYQEKFYYIHNDKKYAFVDCIINDEDTSDVQKACNVVLETLKWNN